MKKLFSTILVLGLLLSGNAYADERNWICNKIDKNISECKSERISGDFKIKEIFVGETSDNLPSGNGKISFEVNGERVDDYAKGFFVLDKDNYLILHTGEQHVDNNIYFKKNEKLYKTRYFNGEVFEGTYYLKTINQKKGIFKSNKGDRYNGTFTKDGQYLNGTYHFKDGDRYKGTFTKDGKYLNGTYYFKDGKNIKYRNSEKIKTIQKTQYILFLIPFIFFIIYKLIKGNKINNSLGKIKNSSKLYLKEKGFKSRGDYSIVIILIIVLGPGTLILISLISEKLLGIYGISKFVDSIFNLDFFIVYIYTILSTLASILWWGFIILEKFSSKKNKWLIASSTGASGF